MSDILIIGASFLAATRIDREISGRGSVRCSAKRRAAAPASGFAGALKFAGRSAPQAEIERAIRHADFAELQRQESEKGFAERTSRNAPFFRSGRKVRRFPRRLETGAMGSADSAVGSS